MIFDDATLADAAAIAAVVNMAYRGEGAREGWTNERGLLDGARISEEGVRSLIERGRILVLRKSADGAIAGCINIAIDSDGAWHTSMLAVAPDEQTGGIGKTIKQEVERQARAAGAPRMRMEVIRQREALMAWHCRRGYEPTGETLPFPYADPSVGQALRDDLELVVMEKPLTEARHGMLKRVSFRNRSLEIAGNLHLPDGFDEMSAYPALVLATPGSSVKEQIGAIYAAKMAERGFVALTFDPSYQGESTGEPRDLEDPSARVEDIRSAIDFLMTQPFVGEERIGLLGICAGGGYAVNAALTEHRVKALGTVVAIDIGQAFRRMLPDVCKTLEEVGKQRTAEARGAAHRRDPWIPDSLEEAELAGLTDPELLEAVKFYRESGYRHHNSSNRLLFSSYAGLIGFDAFNLVPELLTQPLQIIVAGQRGNTGQYEVGHRLFDLSPAAEKHLSVVEGASHYDMYYRPESVDQAVGCLAPFYAKHLGA